MMTNESEQPTQDVEVSPKFPFRTLHIFFANVSVQRENDVSVQREDDVSVQREDEVSSDVNSLSSQSIAVEAAYGFNDDNEQHSLNLHFTSSESSHLPVKIEVNVIGVFEQVDKEAQIDAALISKFVNERLLPEILSRFIQFIGGLTALMGISPIWLPTPRGFGFSLEELLKLSDSETDESQEM